MTHRVRWLHSQLMTATSSAVQQNSHIISIFQYSAEQTARLLNLSIGRFALKNELIYEIERRRSIQIARPIIASLSYNDISDLVCSYI